jgi:hypothetical protein
MEDSGAVPATVSSLKVLPPFATVRKLPDGKAVKPDSEKRVRNKPGNLPTQSKHHSLRVKGYGGEKKPLFFAIPEKAVMKQQ